MTPDYTSNSLKVGRASADFLASRERQPACPRHILVVEDSPSSNGCWPCACAIVGRPVRGMLDGPSALEDMAADPPVLVILDIGLPGMDAGSCSAACGSTPSVAGCRAGPHRPRPEEYRLEADRRGADGFMTSPSSPMPSGRP